MRVDDLDVGQRIHHPPGVALDVLQPQQTELDVVGGRWGSPLWSAATDEQENGGSQPQAGAKRVGYACAGACDFPSLTRPAAPRSRAPLENQLSERLGYAGVRGAIGRMALDT
jgi:hypothetical protein